MGERPIVLITGATGYLGSHVVDQALKAGYSVRAVARGAKADHLREFYKDSKDAPVEVVSISDVSKDDFGEALKGVHAVIHVASPLMGQENPEGMFAGAVEGTLNVVRQAESAGVRKVVVTASIVNVWGDTFTCSNEAWNPITKEQAVASGDNPFIYIASKVAAERALWEWTDAHPHVEVTTILPSLIYGPFAPSFSVPKPSLYAISTQLIIYHLIHPNGGYHEPLAHRGVDVRDVARIHISAIDSPSTKEVGRKRLVLSSPYAYEFGKIRNLIYEERPELRERLIRAPVPEQKEIRASGVDYERVEQVTGFKREEWTTMEQTVLDGIDSLYTLERRWKDSGYDLPELVPWGEAPASG